MCNIVEIADKSVVFIEVGVINFIRFRMLLAKRMEDVCGVRRSKYGLR